MVDSPYKRGRKDFGQGRISPPDTYYSALYREEWQRGYNAAEGAQAMVDEAAGKDNDLLRYMPASYRAMHELEQSLGQDAAEKIKALVEAMISEAAPSH